MIKYVPAFLKTPAQKPVPVNVINPQYEIKQGRRRYAVPLVDESGIRFVAECAKEAVNHNRDCMIEWTGWRGVGKSTGILKTALAINPSITEESVAFWLEDITRLFATNPQGDGSKGVYPQIISDETGYALHGKQWQTRAQIEIAKNMIINRVMRQIFHIAAPDRMQVNHEIRNMAFMWIHVSEPDWYKQGYAVVRFAPPQLQSEFYSSKFWEPKLAFVYRQLDGPLWERYEAKKIQFVKDASTLTASGKNLKTEKHSTARDRLMKELYNYRKTKGDPISCEALGELVGLRTTQTWSIISSEG